MPGVARFEEAASERPDRCARSRSSSNCLKNDVSSQLIIRIGRFLAPLLPLRRESSERSSSEQVVFDDAMDRAAPVAHRRNNGKMAAAAICSFRDEL